MDGAQYPITEQEIYKIINWNPIALTEHAVPLINNFLNERNQSPIGDIESITLSKDPHRAEGTQSRTFRLEVRARRRGTGIATSDLLFFLKKCFEGFRKEQAVLTVAQTKMPPRYYSHPFNRTLQVFPTALNTEQDDPQLKLHSAEFNRKNLLLLEAIPHATLEERFLEIPYPEPRDAESYLDPVVLLHERFSKHSKLIEQALDGEKIPYLSEDVYINKLLRAASTISERNYTVRTKIVREKEEEQNPLEEAYKAIAEPLFKPKIDAGIDSSFKWVKLIQRAGWYFHDMGISLIDPEKIVFGHRAWQIACLLAHPNIYNQFENPQEAMRELTKAYILKAERFSDYKFSREQREELSKDLLDATMAAAILAVVDSAEARKKYDNSRILRPHAQTVQDQCKYFGDRGELLWGELEYVFRDYLPRNEERQRIYQPSPSPPAEIKQNT